MSAVYTIPQIRSLLYPIFVQNGIKKAVLFGSYGKGTATPASDIDLLVDSNLKGLSFVGFMGEVQQTLDKNVDIFDVTHIETDSIIDREIKATGVTLYEK